MLTYVYGNGRPQMGSPIKRQGILGYREKERVPTWPLRSPPCWEVPAGRGSFITPLPKALPKDHKEQESGGVCE